MTNSNVTKNNLKAVSEIAAKVMRDRQLLLMLSDQVYELMLEDLQHQRERGTNYGRRLNS
ncbi:hypothetical protein I8748_01760 [Nostoc sp. CENA67]|uniref:Uncharacterized protein n=1 Tax=Amazonocrinis nigriterrae CENA67 TaxID=2794033 RepID=A0A8J7HJS3_9NOST|nr:hypothetical protein [Amazonocrinis nigriterrae]MBH8560917.1 hypothetical protein [Amazonocrinis nigriterrae CENA67]